VIGWTEPAPYLTWEATILTRIHADGRPRSTKIVRASCSAELRVLLAEHRGRVLSAGLYLYWPSNRHVLRRRWTQSFLHRLALPADFWAFRVLPGGSTRTASPPRREDH
jgi:hypothetical protein